MCANMVGSRGTVSQYHVCYYGRVQGDCIPIPCVLLWLGPPGGLYPNTMCAIMVGLYPYTMCAIMVGFGGTVSQYHVCYYASLTIGLQVNYVILFM